MSSFYRKNPALEIEGVIYVEGEPIDDSTVVYGDKFAKFADPSTFPGKTPKLIPVKFAELSQKEIKEIQEKEAKKGPEPPKSLGPTTTANFQSGVSGELRITSEPVVDTGTKEDIVSKPELSKKLNVIEEAQSEENAPLGILEVYDDEAGFTEAFPGITSTNAPKVIKKFETLEGLKTASNTELRQAGVRSNYYRKIRDKANQTIKEINEG